MTLEEAVAYFENIPDADVRRPSVSIGWMRTENFRRNAIRKNGNPLVSYDCQISFYVLPGEGKKYKVYSDWHCCRGNASDVSGAIDKAVVEAKKILIGEVL